MKKDIHNLQKNLSFLIESSDFTMATVAKMAGVNKSTLHNYLNGISLRPLATIESLANFFGVSPADLLYRDLEFIAENGTELADNEELECRFEISIKPIDIERFIRALQQKS